MAAGGECMGYLWLAISDWNRIGYPEVLAVMECSGENFEINSDRERFVIKTATGWHALPVVSPNVRTQWVGPFATWQQAAAVVIAKESLDG